MKAKTESNTVSLAVIGVDIGKEVFHLVGLGADGKIAFRKKIGRLGLKDAFEKLSPCITDTPRLQRPRLGLLLLRWKSFGNCAARASSPHPRTFWATGITWLKASPGATPWRFAGVISRARRRHYSPFRPLRPTEARSDQQSG
jgi:hypothetical protein